MREKRGTFITIEGIEGAGKSTVIKLIERYFLLHNVDVVMTREPGGTLLAEQIRDLVLSYHDESVAEDTELLLFFASRAQHIARVIQPALDKGITVICDRFTDASYAYQCGGRGIAEERVALLESWVQGELQPDLTLLLDLPIKMGLSRIKSRETLDRFEVEEVQFYERVRAEYLKRAKRYPERFRVIDSSMPLDSLRDYLLNLLDNEFLAKMMNEEQ